MTHSQALSSCSCAISQTASPNEQLAQVLQRISDRIKGLAPTSKHYDVVAEAYEQMRQSQVRRTRIPQYFRSAVIEPGSTAEVIYNCLNKGISAYVCGNPGTGKTYAACAAALELDRHGKDVFFTTMSDYLDLCKSSSESDKLTLDALLGAECLVVDDLDKISLGESAYRTEKLYALIESRVHMATVYTSNVSYAKLGEMIVHAAPSFAGAIISRLQGDCGKELVVTGSDKRLERWK